MKTIPSPRRGLFSPRPKETYLRICCYGAGLIMLLALGIAGFLFLPGTTAVLLITAGIIVFLLVILYAEILRPIKHIRQFARRAAAGNTDILLESSEHASFGAFAESFDLIQDGVRQLLEKEQAANQQKREMIAALSHDIRNPATSIQVAAELMGMTEDSSKREKMQAIRQKAEQIHVLVSDLFTSTLDEADSLSVNPISFPGNRLAGIISQADYLGRARQSSIPDCVLRVDPARLAQVIDNIISNSYKYAGSAASLDISAETAGSTLMLVFRDDGPGVAPEELPLLCKRYYRGRTADTVSGYGLGLYISHTLVELMGGRLECANALPGFLVRIWLPLEKARHN
ncbi:MAG: HAMP domain-containing histidine kinase [Gracilibacteraceae bacterium]|nr:HAMP domain-containing histidine kinase [Gracilibacteraceae bacterium]